MRAKIVKLALAALQKMDITVAWSGSAEKELSVTVTWRGNVLFSRTFDVIKEA
jgi:hypothetical protein